MAKFILTIDRNLPTNLFTPRQITTTAEIDCRFYPDGRIPLLLPQMPTLPRRLRLSGAERDEGGSVFVRYGATIDFSTLDKVLPFAARQIIVPVLGDLIPATSWGSSLANLLTVHSWDALRQRTFVKTGFRCETCGTDQDLECHELWEYHEPLPEYLAQESCGVQQLIRLMALCSDCHETHHLGLANSRGRGKIVTDRIRAYNRWNAAELEKYCGFLDDRYIRRCECAWLLDVSCVAPAPLVVREKWQIQDDGFLHANTKTGESITLILGSAWSQDGVNYPAVSPLKAFLADTPTISMEWKYIGRRETTRT